MLLSNVSEVPPTSGATHAQHSADVLAVKNITPVVDVRMSQKGYLDHFLTCLRHAGRDILTCSRYPFREGTLTTRVHQRLYGHWGPAQAKARSRDWGACARGGLCTIKPWLPSPVFPSWQDHYGTRTKCLVCPQGPVCSAGVMSRAQNHSPKHAGQGSSFETRRGDPLHHISHPISAHPAEHRSVTLSSKMLSFQAVLGALLYLQLCVHGGGRD